MHRHHTLLVTALLAVSGCIFGGAAQPTLDGGTPGGDDATGDDVGQEQPPEGIVVDEPFIFEEDITGFALTVRDDEPIVAVSTVREVRFPGGEFEDLEIGGTVDDFAARWVDGRLLMTVARGGMVPALLLGAVDSLTEILAPKSRFTGLQITGRDTRFGDDLTPQHFQVAYVSGDGEAATVAGLTSFNAGSASATEQIWYTLENTQKGNLVGPDLPQWSTSAGPWVMYEGPIRQLAANVQARPFSMWNTVQPDLDRTPDQDTLAASPIPLSFSSIAFRGCLARSSAERYFAFFAPSTPMEPWAAGFFVPGGTPRYLEGFASGVVAALSCVGMSDAVYVAWVRNSEVEITVVAGEEEPQQTVPVTSLPDGSSVKELRAVAGQDSVVVGWWSVNEDGEHQVQTATIGHPLP